MEDFNCLAAWGWCSSYVYAATCPAVLTSFLALIVSFFDAPFKATTSWQKEIKLQSVKSDIAWEIKKKKPFLNLDYIMWVFSPVHETLILKAYWLKYSPLYFVE